MFQKLRLFGFFNPKEEFPVQQFLFKEYDHLRSEITTRTQIQYQLITFSLTAAGVFIALKSILVNLLYPILALFIAIAWMQNDIRIGQLGYYIFHNIEPRGKKIGWEHYCKRHPDQSIGGSHAHLASNGILCGTQVFVLVAALLKGPLDRIEMIILGIDIVIIIITMFVVRPHQLPCAMDEE